MIAVERNELIASIKAAQELLNRNSKSNFKVFVKYLKDDYDMQWFHAVICDKLNDFANGKIKKMMILLPPQHGKSELATRLFPAYLLGKNPDAKIAIASYAQTIASKFNRAIQRNIDNQKYADIFPETRLNYSGLLKTNFDNYSRNEHEFEIVEHEGSVRTIGRGGPLTGTPVDIGIIDDLYKDRAEAKSNAISVSAWDWYVDVFKTRLHNGSQQLIMNTRWDEFDICGRLLVDEPGEWVVIKFPGIRTKDINDYDTRDEGEALWPGKHSLERLIAIKRQSETTFNSLYQQDPKPNSKLLIYPEVIEIPRMPAGIETNLWGIDFGFTNDPTVVVKGGRITRNLYFHECCYQPGLSATTIKIILIANGYKEGEPVFCDHEKEIIAELRLLGINAMPAVKSLLAGIQKLQEYLIHITSSSVNGRKEAGKYQWEVYGNVITNIPVDANNHFWDAARYSFYSGFFRLAGG